MIHGSSPSTPSFSCPWTGSNSWLLSIYMLLLMFVDRCNSWLIYIYTLFLMSMDR
jgi:hypothetical protein